MKKQNCGRKPKPKEGPVICPECQRRFIDKKGLRNHMWQHDASIRFPCSHPGCTKVFGSHRLRHAHMRAHTSGKTFKCDECTAAFKWPRGLSSHKLKVHPKNEPNKFLCGRCSESFRTQGLLTIHMSKAHFNEKRFECSKCKKRFQHEEERETHLVLEHEEEMQQEREPNNQ